jgi:hypothetical protein
MIPMICCLLFQTDRLTEILSLARIVVVLELQAQTNCLLREKIYFFYLKIAALVVLISPKMTKINRNTITVSPAISTHHTVKRL